MEMEQIIKRCNEALDAHAANIPSVAWKLCRGVAIITVSELGFVFSISDGDGVVMSHNEVDGTWSPPSAISLAGAGGGAIFGKATKYVFLLPMTDAAFKKLTASRSGPTQGLLAGVAAGPVGGDADAGSLMDRPMYSYTFEKGALLNIGYDNYGIEARTKVNKDFYGMDTEVIDILTKPGAVDVPAGKGVEEMHKKILHASK